MTVTLFLGTVLLDKECTDCNDSKIQTPSKDHRGDNARIVRSMKDSMTGHVVDDIASVRHLNGGNQNIR
jgi:hypothetical protein